MVKLAWITDPHFDHCSPIQRSTVACVADNQSDYCVITGDISSGTRLYYDLNDFQLTYRKPVYAVLGNHDRYGSSFVQVASEMRYLCASNPNIYWLNDGTVHLIGDTILCGVDGWYDFQYGDTSRIGVIMSDWSAISDFGNAFAHYRCSRDIGPLVKMFRELGQESAGFAKTILSGLPQDCPVIFATHVPPYAESAWHIGKISEPGYLPFFTNKALGLALNEFADNNPDRQLTTLCGHSHSSGRYQARPNHLVLTGEAEYGKPKVQRIFEV